MEPTAGKAKHNHYPTPTTNKHQPLTAAYLNTLLSWLTACIPITELTIAEGNIFICLQTNVCQTGFAAFQPMFAGRIVGLRNKNEDHPVCRDNQKCMCSSGGGGQTAFATRRQLGQVRSATSQFGDGDTTPLAVRRPTHYIRSSAQFICHGPAPLPADHAGTTHY